MTVGGSDNSCDDFDEDVRLRILVADPEPLSREALVAALRARDHRVTAVEDGYTALWYGFDLDRFDALVIDPVLPGKMGGAVARDLQARQPELLVVYISNYDEEFALPGDPLGSVRCTFLRKPVDPAELERLLRRLLRARAK